MKVIRRASAHWDGDITHGSGRVKLGSGAFEGPYSFTTRFGTEPGTNPEELLGAAHAACFTMALSAMLGREGHVPTSLETSSNVTIEEHGGGFVIPHISLQTRGKVPGLSQDEFAKIAEHAKKDCPMSRALSETVEVTLEATLVS